MNVGEGRAGAVPQLQPASFQHLEHVNESLLRCLQEIRPDLHAARSRRSAISVRDDGYSWRTMVIAPLGQISTQVEQPVHDPGAAVTASGELAIAEQ